MKLTANQTLLNGVSLLCLLNRLPLNLRNSRTEKSERGTEKNGCSEKRLRSRAVVARLTHYQEVAGSSPVSATKRSMFLD